MPYAICYVITRDGKVEGFTTATSIDCEKGSEYLIQAANEYGGLSKAAKPGKPTAVDGTTDAEGGFKADAVYSVSGARKSAVSTGLNILTGSGKSRKVMVK